MKDISKYDPISVKNAEDLKKESLALIAKATEPAVKHADEITHIYDALGDALEYEKGKAGIHTFLFSQWQILARPENNLLGGFLKAWTEKKEGYAETFIANIKKNVSEALDEIITLAKPKEEAEKPYFDKKLNAIVLTSIKQNPPEPVDEESKEEPTEKKSRSKTPRQDLLVDLSQENNKLPKEICEAAEEYCTAWSFEQKTKERLEKAEAVLRLRMLDKQTMKIKFYDKIEGDFVDFFFKVDTKKVCTSGLE